MNPYYPVFLNLMDRDVLVVGAGKIALRKIETLLKHRAKVTVVANRARRKIEELAAQGKISLFARNFEMMDLEGRDLVYCSTDDEALNSTVGRECMKRKIWVNVVDRPDFCSFIVPAVVPRGDVTVAISTGGASPAFAKFLRKKTERHFGPEVGAVAKILKSSRGSLLKMPMNARKKFLREVLSEQTLQQVKRGNRKFLTKKLSLLKEKN